MSWTESARCAELEAEGKVSLNDFFPENDTPKAAIDRAKRACSGCPVKAVCLNYAIENGIDYGIWGGVPARRRRAMRLGLRNVA